MKREKKGGQEMRWYEKEREGKRWDESWVERDKIKFQWDSNLMIESTKKYSLYSKLSPYNHIVVNIWEPGLQYLSYRELLIRRFEGRTKKKMGCALYFAWDRRLDRLVQKIAKKNKKERKGTSKSKSNLFHLLF